MFWELHRSYEHAFPCAFRAAFQQIQYWQSPGIPGRSGFRQSKQFLGQQASGSGRMTSLYCQRHDAKHNQQQPWCGMAVVPPMNSSDFTNLSISLSAKWAATLALQGFPKHTVTTLHFSFTPFPLVKSNLIQSALTLSQLEQQNLYQLLLCSEEVMFILCKSSQRILLISCENSGVKGDRLEIEIFLKGRKVLIL